MIKSGLLVNVLEIAIVVVSEDYFAQHLRSDLVYVL